MRVMILLYKPCVTLGTYSSRKCITSMERVGALINKLKEQYEQRVDKNHLLVTVQMLITELQQEQEPATTDRKNVSVIVPKVKPIIHEMREAVKQEIVIPKLPEEKKQEPGVEELPEKKPEPVTPSIVDDLMKYTTQTPITIPTPQPQQSSTPASEVPNSWLFDTTAEVPTLTHQKEVYELNDVHINDDSLNNKLREDKVELAATLKDAPVRDLRKAIGINDRYRFINELFRGDESMYERSIKTINSFNILAEAEYWIQRELKVKMGWSEENEAVKLFDQTVRRRFN